MYCSHCGKPNAEGAGICESCQRPVLARPALAGAGPVVVSNHLVWAILATLLCCLPTGIVAIVYAAQVDGKAAAGDVAGAMQASSNAATWSWVSFGLGVLVIVAYAGLGILGAAAGGR